jgi:hypothetical protein
LKEANAGTGARALQNKQKRRIVSKAICAKNFEAKRMNAGRRTSVYRAQTAGKTVLHDQECKDIKNNKREAHKRREQISPVFIQVGNLSHSR